MPKKAPTLDPEVELEEDFDEEFDETANKMDEAFKASLTVAVPDKPKEEEEPRVTIILPKLLGDEDGVKVDQYEHVTIANERGEICYKVLRGEYVDVPISVFIVLKQKYPKL